ncbi:hypothetical protein A3H81_03405 [Candidatus Daviesbacteria bacterium RIFCSPLOWO2_02_FULL_38_18]|nr:MAG: hypothetical protein A2772_01265 [Candidatus Daviesbacteria bacterium RIFCSPHIGHO2_01_FULL_38_8b]OGE68927.1 MAG: hypothetical protein A3H81_03405 [Candidatus Daviesbacteria bacterium RIFCSPLOWO2_02_FULL_38_18]OGE73153.1 MAG: hypothetical protein A3H18_05285 [Candidatus Daviesbacteria bacterium RIFCSPLOWO2_12_FULL_38_10]HAB52074.1 ribose-phosphate pyrophosphokinase [Ignavibacteriales bacterium]
MTSLEQDNGYVLMTGRSNPQLAKEIGSKLGKAVLEPVSNFSDGETRVFIDNSLRKRDVVIIQPTSPPVNEHIMELLLMIDAAKRASAGEITAVIPYFGYARQDRKDGPRVPISSEVVTRMIEAMGTRRIITMDLHTDQQMGFFTGPWDNLTAKNVLLQPIKAEGLNNLVVSSTDHGGISRAKKFKEDLEADGVAIVYKERDASAHDRSRTVDLLGDVKGKNVLFVDDIITTAGSLVNAAEFVEEIGALDIYAAITHGLFIGQALERIKDSPIKKLFVTDTAAQRPEILSDHKIFVATVAPFLAEAIRRVQGGISMSVDMF